MTQGDQKGKGLFQAGTLETGKIPPQAIEIENAILGALMIDPRAFDDVSGILKAEFFYIEAHQLIYEAMHSLHKNQSRIDMLTVIEELRSKGKLENVGGAYFVAQLTNSVGTAAHIEYHAKIVIEKYLKRELIRISYLATVDGFDDLADVFDSFAKTYSALEKAMAVSTGNYKEQSWEEVLTESVDLYSKRKDAFRIGKIDGIPTPVNDLTNTLIGWQPNKLYIIAARPGMGKTAFVIESMRVAAQADYPVVIFSLEMDSISLADRVITGEAGVDAQKYRGGCLTNEEEVKVRNAALRLKNLNITLDDNALVNFEYLRSKARRLHKAGKCKMVIIDYVGLIEVDRSKGKNREQEVAEISRKAKIMSKELSVPVLLVAQLNRDVEKRNDRRPQLSDLRETGSLEQDADAVLFIYRDEVYDKETMNRGEGEIIVAKHRAGKTGTIGFRYNESMTRFGDLSNWE